MRKRFIFSALMMVVPSGCHSQQPMTRLTNAQATIAMRHFLPSDKYKVVLGTCKPALHPEHEGQTACTLLAVSSGATSETQADFYWNGKAWASDTSSSQSILPFPDPVLFNIHSDTKIDPTAGPIR